MRLSPRALVAAWELLKRRAIDVFRPGVLASLSEIPGWSALVPGRTDDPTGPPVPFLHALRALALIDRGNGEDQVDLVATLPLADGTLLATADVMRTMLESARSSILIVGFEISELAVRNILFRRAIDQIEITVVADRQRGSARELLKDWPAIARAPRVLTNVEPVAQAHAFLHAKVLVVDQQVALIGSANFTSGGLRHNFEIGVRATGAMPRRITALVERLERAGWIVPITLDG